MANIILRLPAVKTYTGLSRSSIYLAVSKGTFPQPIKLGARSVGWLESEIEAWLRQQVEAEAEILHIIRKLKDQTYKLPGDSMVLERTYFLSQSRVLDRIPPAAPVSWTPEALYRYILALPGESLNPDLLQRCMLQEYFASGVIVIDTPRYEKFFGPTIDIANTTYTEERDKYLKEFQDVHASTLDEAFHCTPDLDKTFFVQQMGWKVARQEHLRVEAAENKARFARKQADLLSAELIKVKQEASKDWKRKENARNMQIEAEARNAADPKHLRKRSRQAKKRGQKHKR
jgi:prophage regulatory protein